MPSWVILYLLFGTPLRWEHFSDSLLGPFIIRLQKRLATWKGKMLSLGGRITLIKSSLSTLSLYYMSLFSVPIGVVENIVKIQRNFLWCGNDGKKGFPLITWERLEFSKALGGLGIGNLLHRNLTLLFKWFWRFY